VLAFSAVASASASANTLGFKYTGMGVNKAKFSGKGGTVSFEGSEGEVWQCGSSTTSGEIGGASGSAKLAGVFVTFSECKLGAKPCSSVGQASGVMKTGELAGELGYLSETELGRVGLLLKPKPGAAFMACKSGTITNEFVGGLIGNISPVNKATGTKSQFTVTYDQSLGVQELHKFAGGGENALQESYAGGAYENAGVQGSVGIQPLEGEIEIAETL
jgi:hypothetical protein